jgi:exoribonuclease R
MPRRYLTYRPRGGEDLRAGFDAIRRELKLPAGFPASVLDEATQASSAPVLPALDLTEIPFLTIDPPESMDLDQALYIERRGPGYRLHYAIADVASFLRPGGVLDAECHRRVTTLYLPDGRTPLHPTVLSEGAASLLPGQVRPAVVWTISLDSSGEPSGVVVRRGLVRSIDRYDYAEVQALVDGGTAEERLLLLRELGELRSAREADRGGVDLPVPEQDIVEVPGPSYELVYRSKPPAEQWNAQMSLLTGMAAAELMVAGGIGLLRTLYGAPPEEVTRLRRVARGLGVSWPDDMQYDDLVRSLDPAVPAHAALIEELTILLRGSGYAAFDGAAPPQAVHAAVAAPYAHVTAPLRRLADRYATEVCLCLVAGVDVPEWVRAALPALPDEMSEGARRAGAVENACISLVEAHVLRDRIGEVFDAVVIDANREGGTVQLPVPPVRARCVGDRLPLGERVRVRLVHADPVRREVRFALALALA